MTAIAPVAPVVPTTTPTVTTPTRNALLSSLGTSTVVAFDAGHVFYTEGDDPDCLYVIVEGKVKIGRTARDGRVCTLTVLGPGDVFGDVSLLDLGPRTATAAAMTDVRATPMNRAQLLRRLATEPSAADDLLRVMARRVRRGTENLADLMSSDVPARICKHLLRLAQQFGVQLDGGVQVELDLNQEQFARMVGTCRETVNKTLAELSAAGWIRVDRDAIFIIDSQPLVHRSSGVQRSRRPRRSVTHDGISDDDDRLAGNSTGIKRHMGFQVTEVQHCLKGFDYPGSPKDLAEHARANGADDDLVNTLQGLDKDSFDGPSAVMQALGSEDALGGS